MDPKSCPLCHNNRRWNIQMRLLWSVRLDLMNMLNIARELSGSIYNNHGIEVCLHMSRCHLFVPGSKGSILNSPTTGTCRYEGLLRAVWSWNAKCNLQICRHQVEEIISRYDLAWQTWCIAWSSFEEMAFTCHCWWIEIQPGWIAFAIQSASQILLIDALEPSMTTKSTATLHSRANPMLRFIKWCKYNALQPFPMDHVVVFKHLQMIKDTCALTLAKSVLGSIAFIIFCMGLASGKKVLEPCEWKEGAWISNGVRAICIIIFEKT